MDLKAAVQILDRWVTVNMKQHTGKKPGVSFIISTILKYPTTRHIAEEFGGYDFLRIAYIIFELHEGSTYEEALAKTEIIYFVEVYKYEDLGHIDEGCEECDGTGSIDCSECTDGMVECNSCEGAGEIENGDETEDCSVCDGSGQESCNECWGEGETECTECDGSGRVESYDEYFRLTKTIWTFLSNDIYEKIRDIEEMNDDDKYIKEDDFLDDVFGEGKDLFLLRSNNYDSDDITHDDAPTDISDGDSVVRRYGDIKHERYLTPVIIGDRLRV